MTEAEWLASTAPDEMIVAVVPRLVSFRKLRLFLVGCCRRRWNLIQGEHLDSAVEVAEQFADGGASQVELDTAMRAAGNSLHWAQVDSSESYSVPSVRVACEISRAVWVACHADPDLVRTFESPVPHCFAGFAPDSLARAEAWSRRAAPVELHAIEEEVRSELAADAELLRCVAGNPFRPTGLPDEWRTSTVVGLAAGIYEDRAFDRLPILADSLEDAGCDRAHMLIHCRGGGEHTRGCWVVDAILGKS